VRGRGIGQPRLAASGETCGGSPGDTQGIVVREPSTEPGARNRDRAPCRTSPPDRSSGMLAGIRSFPAKTQAHRPE